MGTPRAGRLRAGVAAAVLSFGLLGAVPPGPAAAMQAAPAGPFVVALSGTLTAVAAPGELVYGSTTSLVGMFTDPAGVPAAGEPVVAEAQTATGWVVVAGPVPTDAAGVVALPVAPAASSVLRLRHLPMDPAVAAAVSLPLTVTVRVALRPSPGRATVATGRPVTVSGTVAPAPAGAVVRIERLEQQRWRPAGVAPVSGDGSWSAQVSTGAPGVDRLRVVRRAFAGVGAETVELAAIEVVRVHRYSVAIRGRAGVDRDLFAAAVAATYADPRGWARAHHRFREVPGGGDFTVVLAAPRLLPTYSRVCSTSYSCRVGRHVIINQERWRRGSPYFPGNLATYRRMVLNHETGHWLGRGHAFCPRDGAPAPVMQQQSKGMAGCRPNPWPLPREIRAVS